MGKLTSKQKVNRNFINGICLNQGLDCVLEDFTPRFRHKEGKGLGCSCSLYQFIFYSNLRKVRARSCFWFNVLEHDELQVTLISGPTDAVQKEVAFCFL